MAQPSMTITSMVCRNVSHELLLCRHVLLDYPLHSPRSQAYSLTDCISMQVMRHEGLTDVLTNDRHFTQEGFHIIFP
jgi:hypothetical protein